MKSPTPPPEIIENLRVLEYAMLDESVLFTGRLRLYVDENLLGAVPRLVICEDIADGALVLLHCDEEWKCLGVQAWNGLASPPVIDVAQIKEEAERFYVGLSMKWQLKATKGAGKIRRRVPDQ